MMVMMKTEEIRENFAPGLKSVQRTLPPKASFPKASLLILTLTLILTLLLPASHALPYMTACDSPSYSDISSDAISTFSDNSSSNMTYPDGFYYLIIR